MEFQKVIEERFSVRSFKEQEVPTEVINAILEAGRIAPTGCNFQPQRITVIKSREALEKLKDCTRCHFDAPLAMLVSYDDSVCWHRPYDGAACGPVDASIVTTHMMLRAWELGIGSCWVMHFNPEKIKNAFELSETEVPMALLVMGYADESFEPNSKHFESQPIEALVREV